MSAKRAMGKDPLDSLMPEEKTSKKRAAPATEAEGNGRTKVKTSFNLTPDIVEEARDAAWWARLTLAELAEEALRREIARLAKKAGHKDGVFPKRERELKSGRPTG